MQKLLIHQISEEIKQVETENTELKRRLILTSQMNIIHKLCLDNNFEFESLKNFLGEKTLEKLYDLIVFQENEPNKRVLSFEWDGKIYFWFNNLPSEIKSLQDLKEKVNVWHQ